MKTKNLGDPYNKSIHLRLSEKEYNYICDLSLKLDILPSQLLRMMIDSYIPEQASDSCQFCIYKKGRIGL